jgi:hypothetical protein
MRREPPLQGLPWPKHVPNADAPNTSVADHIRHASQREQRVAWCQTRCQMQFGQQVCNTYCY